MRTTPAALTASTDSAEAGTPPERPQPRGLTQPTGLGAAPSAAVASASAAADAGGAPELQALQACSTPACVLLQQAGAEPGTEALRQIERARHEPEEVMRDCERGLVDACLATVAYFDTQPKGARTMPEEFLDRATRQLNRQCAAGDVASCLQSVEVSTAQVRARRTRPDAEVACKAGSYNDCFWLVAALGDSAESTERGEGLAFGRRAVSLAASRCDGGDVTACLMLQTYHLNAKWTTPDKAKAAYYLERARSLSAGK